MNWRALLATMAVLVFIVAVVGAILAISGCTSSGIFPTGDFEIHLPKGYLLIRTEPDSVAMCYANTEVLVESNIDGYRVYNDAVVGHVVKFRKPMVHSVPGYFIVDLKTGKVQQGLSQKKWLAALRKYGIKSAPTLHQPSYQDESLGYNKPGGP
jgi:hypothetical protein